MISVDTTRVFVIRSPVKEYDQYDEIPYHLAAEYVVDALSS
jgi:hypothetical protein